MILKKILTNIPSNAASRKTKYTAFNDFGCGSNKSLGI